jgi:hypothetical protein
MQAYAVHLPSSTPAAVKDLAWCVVSSAISNILEEVSLCPIDTGTFPIDHPVRIAAARQCSRIGRLSAELLRCVFFSEAKSLEMQRRSIDFRLKRAAAAACLYLALAFAILSSQQRQQILLLRRLFKIDFFGSNLPFVEIQQLLQKLVAAYGVTSCDVVVVEVDLPEDFSSDDDNNNTDVLHSAGGSGTEFGRCSRNLFRLLVAENVCLALGRNLCSPVDSSAAQSRSMVHEHVRVTLSIALRWCTKLRLLFESSLWACPVYALDTRAWGSANDFVALIAPGECSAAEARAYRSTVRRCCTLAVVTAEIAKYSAWISIRLNRDLNQRAHFDFKELSAVAILKQPGDLLRALCVNANDNQMVIVATPKGIRQMKALQPMNLADALGRADVQSDNFEVQYNEGFVTCLAAHPVLPVFISGSSVGTIELWHFSFPQPIKRYCALSSTSLCSIEFNATGSRFACGDSMGNTGVWNFESSEFETEAFQQFRSHNKKTTAIQFIGNGGILVTAGISSTNRNLCIWDFVLPSSVALLHSFECHDSGASSLVYSQKQNLLVSGGRKGELCVWDMLQVALLHTIPAHLMNVRSLCVDSDSILVSGSTDGDMKVWKLPEMSIVATWTVLSTVVLAVLCSLRSCRHSAMNRTMCIFGSCDCAALRKGCLRDCRESAHAKKTFLAQAGTPISTYGVSPCS